MYIIIYIKTPNHNLSLVWYIAEIIGLFRQITNFKNTHRNTQYLIEFDFQGVFTSFNSRFKKINLSILC